MFRWLQDVGSRLAEGRKSVQGSGGAGRPGRPRGVTIASIVRSQFGGTGLAPTDAADSYASPEHPTDSRADPALQWWGQSTVGALGTSTGNAAAWAT